MEIRQRRDHDLDALVPLAARVHEADNYPILLPDGDHAGFLTRPEPLAAWVAVEGEQMLGHVALNETTSRPVLQLVREHEAGADAVYVARLLVDPDSRRRGIGGQLLDGARRAAFELGRCPFLDVVDIPTARPAISLYRRAGWDLIGRVSFELVTEEVDELVFSGGCISPE